MLRFFSLTTVVLLLPILAAVGQGARRVDTLRLAASDSLLRLPVPFVVRGSIMLRLDSTTLQPPHDFTSDERFGIITPSPALRQLLADTLARHLLVAQYRYLPLGIAPEYALRRLVTRVDSSGGRRDVAEQSHSSSGGLAGSDIFGKNFQRSGSVIRGLTVGSNRDLTVQSGLRLQFSGPIADSVIVTGAVTDEQTPIQPEGNTQTLREVDNIFIEVRSPVAGATLGKFLAASTGSEYLGYSRKLQGVKGNIRGGEFGTGEVVAAVAPGRFLTQALQGRERDQGPYRLTGTNGERNIVVVAGTERVFVDGVEMIRGESNDYVIDYSTGEVFFQTRRPITSQSRITVDFELADRRYSRSFLALNHSLPLLNNALTLGIGFLREADNQDAPIDLTIDDADRQMLAQVGGDPLAAIRSGVRFVGRSDTTFGSYYRIDTTIDGKPDSLFIYSPTDPRALFNVSFSVPANGVGDYESVAFGEYRFVGKNAGRYMPVVFLPLPELRQVFGANLNARPAPGVSLSGEFAFSDGSVNRFSALPSANRQGGAFKGFLSIQRDSVRVGGVAIGSIRADANARYVNRGFRSVERLGDVEFGNQWNTAARLGEGGTDDFVAEGTLRWQPLRRLELNGSGGWLNRDGLFTSLRQQYGAQFRGDTIAPSADYIAELIATRDTLMGGTTSRWLRQRGGISYSVGRFTPGFRFQAEQRDDQSRGEQQDSLLPASFRFVEFGPELRVEFPFLSGTASARFRNEDSARFSTAARQHQLTPDGTAETWALRAELRGVSNLNSTADFTYRTRRYNTIPGVATRLNSVTVLGRWQTRWTGFNRGLDLDGLYQVQTEQAARLQYLYVRVPFGQGEYVWIDLDSNGVQTENEFRLTNASDGEYARRTLQTEQLFPVIDLQTLLRLRLSPKSLLNEQEGLGKWLAPITTETVLRLEEKSQTEKESDIYLLQLSKFQDDSTTLLGNGTIQQDVNLFENNADYSFRLRWLQRTGLTKLFNATERNGSTERSLRARWQPTFDIGLQLDFAGNSSFLRTTEAASTRAFDLTTLSAASDLSYRPTNALEVGWQLKVSATEDVFPATPRTITVSTNQLRGLYSIQTSGRLRAELERTVAAGANIPPGDIYSLPYQLTDGYVIGTTWVGRVTLEYRVSGNIQISVTYTGRAQPPSNRVVHLGQAEVRAFF
ncbi:MAG: hypothetical protein IT211_06050 [Armatimonadetes bacterium]|nr:hypothetical protein [Armatimonadota bacterium]